MKASAGRTNLYGTKDPFRTSWHRSSIFDVKLLNAMFLRDARKCLIASRLPRQANLRGRHRRRSGVRNPGKQTRLKLFLRSIRARKRS